MRGYGGNCRVGKENSFPKLEERFSLRQLSKSFKLLQWGTLNYQWWGQRGEKWKIHWLKWGEMTRYKSDSGMGFCDLVLHNDSLLAKQAWRLLQDKSSLFYKVFKPCFFPNCTIMEVVESRRGSYA